jgi:hypothetical protein
MTEAEIAVYGQTKSRCKRRFLLLFSKGWQKRSLICSFALQFASDFVSLLD